MNSTAKINFLAHELVADLGTYDGVDGFAKKVVPVANRLLRFLMDSELETLLDEDYGAEANAASFARNSLVAQPSNQQFVFSGLSEKQVLEIETYLTGLAIKLIEMTDGAT